ncbi:MAG TPA: universal stress protein [Nocardioidaceae bacterium]|nr:universal stress protein [Nocardioidaceae bacterium]
MKAVVAYRGRDDGGESLELAAMLRRSTGAELQVVGVYPPVSDHPGIERVDLEYREWLSGLAVTARAEVQARLWPDDPDDMAYESVTSTSVAAGLVQAAEAAQADVIVLGSARAAVSGSLILGSVGSRLLHSSPVPILLASPGYHAPDDTPFGCLTVAYAGTERSKEALAAGASLASRYGATLRIATFVPRAKTMYPPEVGLDAEDMVAAQWAEQAAALLDDAVDLSRAAGVADVETAIARGNGWSEALRSIDWGACDLLVLGSSRLGPMARVFLGSTAAKILRSTPVPTLVVPAGTFHWSA